MDFDSVYNCLKELQEMKIGHTPVYSFITNLREQGKQREIQPKNFVIIEGIFAFYDEVFF